MSGAVVKFQPNKQEVSTLLDGLEEGSYIPPEKVEDILGVSREMAVYSFGCMKLREFLEDELQKRGMFVWIKQSSFGLQILKNEETAQHGTEQALNDLRSCARKFHKTQACVRVGELKEEDRDRYDRRMAYINRVLLHSKNEEQRLFGRKTLLQELEETE
jgi:hypothetical protein